MVGVILLAAGGSKRLGTPKQSLLYKGETLLQHALKEALQVSRQVVVVLGAGADELKQELINPGVQLVINAEWEEGMASSIRNGLLSLLRSHPMIEAALVMVCDQPFVSAAVLQQLVNERLTSGKKIIASSYEQVKGVPVLFDKSFFPSLLALKGQEGAKKIIQQHSDEVATVAFPKGNIDIDTMEDYERLKHRDTEIQRGTG
jgi:molybdenum cofactor cytidylyltransferase